MRRREGGDQGDSKDSSVADWFVLSVGLLSVCWQVCWLVCWLVTVREAASAGANSSGR